MEETVIPCSITVFAKSITSSDGEKKHRVAGLQEGDRISRALKQNHKRRRTLSSQFLEDRTQSNPSRPR